MLALIVVTLLTSGGPRYARPEKITYGAIEVMRGHKVVAISHSGVLRKRLPPGRYRVFGRSHRIMGGHICEERHVTIRRRRTAPLKLELYCSIK